MLPAGEYFKANQFPGSQVNNGLKKRDRRLVVQCLRNIRYLG
jgi:hypothetical protein